jgi:hypothetical protein
MHHVIRFLRHVMRRSTAEQKQEAFPLLPSPISPATCDQTLRQCAQPDTPTAAATPWPGDWPATSSHLRSRDTNAYPAVQRRITKKVVRERRR